MRFRTGLVLGLAAGWVIGSRMWRAEHDEGESAGRLAAMAAHPAARRLTDQGRRMAGRAGFKGVEAIQRARASIQRRHEAEPDDFSMN